MVPTRRGVIVALIIGSIVGGTAGATIVTAASHTPASQSVASRSQHERIESAQNQTHNSSSAT